MKTDPKLLEYIRHWLDENEGDFEDDTECLYALSREIESSAQISFKPSLIELRKIYDAEKGER